MKTYTIKLNKKNNSGNFRNSTNASKALDDLIFAGLTKMNPYLKKNKSDNLLDAMFTEAGFGTDDHIIISNHSSILKDDFDTDFAKAAKFLANYTPNKKYILTDGTPIVFFEDEIQIGYDLIPLYKLSSPKYYTLFTPETKKTIINLFITINA